MAIGSSTSFTTTFTVPVVKVPLLEIGDRLASVEFMRRYEAMPDAKKAELVEGTVYMSSPVRVAAHGKPHADLLGWLVTYRAATPGVVAADNCTLQLDNDNVPQPDALLMIETAAGGQATLDAKDYVVGAPELVAEIASSSVSIDMHAKLNVYRRSGVREYLVWRVLDQVIDWFVLREGQYEPMAADGEGVLHSEVFPGLWLNAGALLEGKLDVVLKTLQDGLAAAEHQTFAASLATKLSK
jgi:Uma2 family endonuclease